MRAIVMTATGGPEVLQVRDVPDAQPGPGHVVIEVEAAGVCYHDLLDRSGAIPGARPGAVLGHEVAGRIVAGGDPARHGSRVVVFNREFCGDCRHCLGGRQDLCRTGPIVGSGTPGGYAERIRVPVANAVPVPEGVPAAHAALAVCPVGTSVRALVGVAGARPGDTVLVTGASGGLGLHQIQVAKALGARVIAVSTSPHKVEAIRKVGADEVVVAPDLDFAGRVWALTGKRGVDVVLENVATGTLPSALRSMAPLGIAVVLGNIGVRDIPIDPGLVIGRRLRIAGSGNPTFVDVERGLALMASGAVEPVVSTTFPFEDAAAAHRLMEERGTVGRVVLEGWRDRA